MSRMENKLSECEELIYTILLKSDHALTLMEIKEQAEECFGKEWAIQTIHTFLERMKKKEYISSYRIVKYSRFYPKISLEEYRKEKLYGIREQLLF